MIKKMMFLMMLTAGLFMSASAQIDLNKVVKRSVKKPKKAWKTG